MQCLRCFDFQVPDFFSVDVVKVAFTFFAVVFLVVLVWQGPGLRIVEKLVIAEREKYGVQFQYQPCNSFAQIYLNS